MNKLFRKSQILLLALTLLLTHVALTGCGESESTAAGKSEASKTEASAAKSEEAKSEAAESTGESKASENKSEDKKLKIYTSIFPLYDFTRKIAGDRAEVINLVPAGAEAHSFELTPKDMVALSEADMLVYNGAGMEHWTDTAIKSFKDGKPLALEASAGLELLEAKKYNDPSVSTDPDDDCCICGHHHGPKKDEDHDHEDCCCKDGEDCKEDGKCTCDEDCECDEDGECCCCCEDHEHEDEHHDEDHDHEHHDEDHEHEHEDEHHDEDHEHEHHDEDHEHEDEHHDEDHDHEHHDEDHDHEHHDEDHDHEHGEEGHHHHHHGKFDPHTWLSPVLAKQEAENILKGLKEVDPEGADYYQARYEELAKEFDELNKEYREALNNVRIRTIVVTHKAFGYLCHEYNLEQESISGLEANDEASPAQMARLAELVKTKEIKYIFSEVLLSPKLSETLAKETGTKVAVLNPAEGLSKDAPEDTDYFSIMRENLKVLTEALK